MRTNIVTATAVLFTYYIMPCVGTAIPQGAEALSEVLCQVLLDMGRPCSTPTESTPTTTVEFSDPTNCSIDPTDCALASSSARPTCNTGNECNAYCKKILGSTEGLGSSCSSSIDKSTGMVAEQICDCWNGKGVADIVTHALIGIGEVACFTWDQGLALTEEALKEIGKIRATPAQAMKWAGKVLRVGTHLLADGQKLGKCDNVACPGHRFTVIDPEKLGEELGALNMC